MYLFYNVNEFKGSLLIYRSKLLESTLASDTIQGLRKYTGRWPGLKSNNIGAFGFFIADVNVIYVLQLLLKR